MSASGCGARAEALAEFNHPVLCCFVGLVPVSTLLVSLAIAPYTRALAVALFLVGAIGQLSFGVYRSGQLWMGGRKPEATTPVLYLTTVCRWVCGFDRCQYFRRS